MTLRIFQGFILMGAGLAWLAVCFGPVRGQELETPANEEELVTEPLEEPTPVAQVQRRLGKLPKSSSLQGQNPKPRKYGKGQGRSAPRGQGQIVRSGIEYVTEPVLSHEAEEPFVPEPTPKPRRPEAAAGAKNYSYTPKNSGAAPLPAIGRELATEPLSSGEAAQASDRAAESFGFRAELDRSQVHLDESFTLKLEVTAPDLKGLSAVRLPRLPDFDLINTHHNRAHTNVAGQVVEVQTESYVFLPLKPGPHTLPPAQVTYRGRVFQTQPLDVEVEGSRSGFGFQKHFTGNKTQSLKIMPAAPDTGAPQREAQAEFYSALSRKSVVVNQPVRLSVHLRYQTDPDLKVNYTPPPQTGFLTEELQQTQTEEILSGSQQRFVERIYRTALFPIHAGALTVGSAQVTFTRLGISRTQATEPLNLESKPLPPDPLAKAGEPENGLVGKYALAAELSATRVTVDMPLRLRLTLRGEGNIRVAPAPRLTTAGEARLQLEDRSERVERVQDSIRGELVYHYLLVPVQPGALNLGSALIRYFEPEAGVWRSAEAALPRVQVLPKPVTQETEPVLIAGERRTPHLRPNHGGQARLRTSDQPAAARIDFWALQAAGALVLALVLAGRQWQRRRLSDPVVARALRAFPLARRSLRAAAHHIRRGEISKFYDAMSRTTAEYLAAKFGIATAYIVTERLPELFERFDVPGVFGTRFRVTLTACEYVRFAAVELPEHDMRSLYRDLSRAIEGFEHHWRKRGAVKKAAASGAAVLLLLLTGVGAARAGDAELYFLRGNTYAEQNQQAQALAEYQRIVGMGVSDPDVFYNLGNTYLRLGQIGRAVLAYERGLRLAPRDPDLRANLAAAAGLAVDAQPEEDLGAHPVQSGYRWFTGDELAWAASACYLAALAALILALLWPRAGRVFRRTAVMLGVCALLATGWCAARLTEPYWWKRAVIMTPVAEVRGRPYSESETLYTLHEGTRVTLEREEEEWVEVRFSQGRHGWIMRAALGIIE